MLKISTCISGKLAFSQIKVNYSCPTFTALRLTIKVINDLTLLDVYCIKVNYDWSLLVCKLAAYCTKVNYD